MSSSAIELKNVAKVKVEQDHTILKSKIEAKIATNINLLYLEYFNNLSDGILKLFNIRKNSRQHLIFLSGLFTFEEKIILNAMDRFLLVDVPLYKLSRDMKGLYEYMKMTSSIGRNKEYSRILYLNRRDVQRAKKDRKDNRIKYKNRVLSLLSDANMSEEHFLVSEEIRRKFKAYIYILGSI